MCTGPYSLQGHRGRGDQPPTPVAVGSRPGSCRPGWAVRRPHAATQLASASSILGGIHHLLAERGQLLSPVISVLHVLLQQQTLKPTG